MKLSYNWLCEFIDISKSPQELASIMVNLGLEVESLEKWESVKGGLEGFMIAEVVECSKHPNADKLSCTKVNTGSGDLLNVVCGAPNVAAGQKVVLATIGTIIYSKGEPFEIKKSKIRGEESHGMLCAIDELGLGDSHDGILVLPDEAKVGTLAKDYFKVETDWVYEIGITPNRIDSASHFGTARDIAAFLSLTNSTKAHKPDVTNFKPDTIEIPVKIEIKNNEACKRYCGITIKGVKLEESPTWLKNRLMSIGQRPINNVVDITNYLLHETGQPLHAFDLSKIRGKQVIIKTCEDGTQFKTLDGVERTLDSNDLMICNEDAPMCIAGVFGGFDSGVKDSTKDIFIESAWFNPVWVRKTAKRHSLSTDSSFRFERGADPNNTLYTLKRCALLVKELAGGIICGEATDIYPSPIDNFNFDVSISRICKLIGKKIPTEKIIQILNSLDIQTVNHNEDLISVSVPPYRVDVQEEADIVEEVLRVYGYNQIEIPEKINATLSYSSKPEKHLIQNLVSDFLVSNGFYEAMNNSLTRSAYYEPIDSFNKSIVNIINPLSSELNSMRQTLIFGILETVIRNINFQNRDLKLFEFGNTYEYQTIESNDVQLKFKETNHLLLAITGKTEQKNWTSQGKDSSFYFLKSIVNNILKKLGVQLNKIRFQTTNHPLLSEGQSLKLGNNEIGSVGIINPKILKNFEIEQEVFIADFNWDLILDTIKNNKVKVAELPKFPEVTRDLSLEIDENTTFGEFETITFKIEKELVRNIELFDVYKGKGITEGKKSYAIRFTLLDNERTLTDHQIDNIMSKLLKAFESDLGAKLRA